MKLTKILGLGLLGLTANPLVTNSQTIKLNTQEEIESKLRCTVTYVGRNCTSEHLPIIARCADGQNLSQSRLVKYKHNQLANKTITNVLGYSYKLPSETYAYICAPDCEKTDEKGDVNQFENFAFNEMGVGLSCTLSTYANDEILKVDPYLKNGVIEEVLNQSIITHASSAKQAMQIAADIIDHNGNGEGNIIMAVDQNEAWLMELYTGRQYCAVKLPDDQVCIAGNEFILNSLNELGINKDNAADRCIVSPGLLSMPQQHGLDKYIEGTTEENKDVYHLHLFNTYAKPLIEGGEKDPGFPDYSHMRTWRGFSLFDKRSNSPYKEYHYDVKYPAFLTPYDVDGNVRNDISIYEVMNVYRDEYDDVLADPTATDWRKRFIDAKKAGTLRSIATDATRSIHIMTSDPDKPKEFAVNCWYCPSSANYTPFVLLNSGMDSIDDAYSYLPERYGYDDNCASCVFRKLNALASVDRSKYGLPIQPVWQSFENIYTTQMKQVINDAIKLKDSDARNIINNFNKHVRDVQIEAVRYVTDDLLYHYLTEDHRAEAVHKLFNPLVDIETYLTDLGWSGFSKQGNVITFKFADGTTGSLDIGEGYYGEKGKITIGNTTSDINVRYQDNKVYVDFNVLNNLIGDKTSIKNINIYDYLIKFNHWVWAGPLIAVAVIAGGLVVFLVIRKRKNSKLVAFSC